MFSIPKKRDTGIVPKENERHNDCTLRLSDSLLIKILLLVPKHELYSTVILACKRWKSAVYNFPFGQPLSRVCLVGIISKPELNGQCGVTKGRSADRLYVELDFDGVSRNVLRVKPRNLVKPSSDVSLTSLLRQECNRYSSMLESEKDVSRFISPRNIDRRTAGSELLRARVHAVLDDVVFAAANTSRDVVLASSVASNLCGHSFGSNEAVYTCLDCQVDTTCVLCTACFEQSGHKHHKYQMHLSAGGGYCDCGDHEAWKDAHACAAHASSMQPATETPLSPLFQHHLDNAVSTVLGLVCKVLDAFPKPDQDSLPVLNSNFGANNANVNTDYTDEIGDMDNVNSNTSTTNNDITTNNNNNTTTNNTNHNNNNDNTTTTTTNNNTATTNTNTNNNNNIVNVDMEAVDTASACWCLQLYNDDVHTFDQVIRQLMITLGQNRIENVEKIANVVHHQGRAAVLITTFYVEAMLKMNQLRAIPQNPLVCAVFRCAVVAEHELVLAIFQWLESIANDSALIRQRVCDLLQPVEDESPDVVAVNNQKSPIKHILLSFASLWKEARDVVRNGSFTLLFLEPVHKRQLGLEMLEYYGDLHKIDEDPVQANHEIFSNLYCQVFTVTSIAQWLVDEHNALGVLFEFLRQRLHSGCDADGTTLLTDDDGVLAGEGQRYNSAILDLRYLLEHNCERVVEYLLPFLTSLSYMQRMCPFTIKSGDHVDRDYEIRAEKGVRLVLFIELIMKHVLKGCRSPGNVQMAIPMVIQEIEKSWRLDTTETPHTHLVYGNNVLQFDFTKDEATVFFRLERFLARLIVEASQLIPNLKISDIFENDSAVLRMTERSLRVHVMSAQVPRNVWVRNGNSLPWSLNHLKLFDARADLVLTQVASACLAPAMFLSSLIDRFGLEHWFKPNHKGITTNGHDDDGDDVDHDVVDAEGYTLVKPEKNHQLHAEFFTLLIHVLCERFEPGVGKVTMQDAVRYHIIHLLVRKPLPFSRFKQLLPKDILEFDEFETTLKEVADFSQPKGKTGGTFVLKPEMYSKFHRYYFLYSAMQREEAKEHALMRSKIHFSPPLQLPQFMSAFQYTPQFLLEPILMKCLHLVFLRAAGGVEFPVEVGNPNWKTSGKSLVTEATVHACFYLVMTGIVEADVSTKFAETIATYTNHSISLLSIFARLQQADTHWRNTRGENEFTNELKYILQSLRSSTSPVVLTALSEASLLLQTDVRNTIDIKQRRAKLKSEAKERQAKVLAKFAKLQIEFMQDFADTRTTAPALSLANTPNNTNNNTTTITNNTNNDDNNNNNNNTINNATNSNTTTTVNATNTHAHATANSKTTTTSTTTTTYDNSNNTTNTDSTNNSNYTNNVTDSVNVAKMEGVSCIICLENMNWDHDDGCAQFAFVQTHSALTTSSEEMALHGPPVLLESCGHGMHIKCAETWKAQQLERVRYQRRTPLERVEWEIAPDGKKRRVLSEYFCPLCNATVNISIPTIKITAASASLTDTTSAPTIANCISDVALLKTDLSKAHTGNDLDFRHDALTSHSLETKHEILILNRKLERLAQNTPTTTALESTFAYGFHTHRIRRLLALTIAAATLTTVRAEDLTRRNRTLLALRQLCRLSHLKSNHTECKDVLSVLIPGITTKTDVPCSLTVLPFMFLVDAFFALSTPQARISLARLCLLLSLVQHAYKIFGSAITDAKLFTERLADCSLEVFKEACEPVARQITLLFQISDAATLSDESLTLEDVWKNLKMGSLKSYLGRDATMSVIQHWLHGQSTKTVISSIQMQSLVQLPSEYRGLFQRACEVLCPQTQTPMLHPAMCLACGAFFCTQSNCCNQEFSHSTDELNPFAKHIRTCSVQQHTKGSFTPSFFLLVKKCNVLVCDCPPVYDTHQRERMVFVDAPYVDAHGETDPNLTRGRPLYLNKEAFDRLNHLFQTQRVGFHLTHILRSGH